MKIIIARNAGFCMGVRRAVEMGLDAGNKHERPVCTFGPLIHNPQVLSLLEEKGIAVLEQIPPEGSGTVLIRAHGVPPDVRERLAEAGFRVMDATCPRVIKVQTIIRKHARKGYDIIILGDIDHPEVAGLLGHAEGKGHVVDTLEAVRKLPAFENAILVAQTTQNSRFFQTVKAYVAERFPHYLVFDTICDSTEKRQAEVERLTGLVDAVIVVGGLSSGNTQRLAGIVREAGKPVFHIETEAELDPVLLQPYRRVGITAGASTPNWTIKRVYRFLEALSFTERRPFRTAFFNLQRKLLLTSVYLAAGAGCLTYAASRLQGATGYFPQALVAMLYVFSMHILNHLTGDRSDWYNDPERADFYQKHRLLLSILAVAAGGAGLLKAYTMGYAHFSILLVMSGLGISYKLRLVPAGARFKYRRIKDIPGSKTVLIALAWGVVTALLPALSQPEGIGPATLPVFVWATAIVFVRTAFFDILDMQGDRIVGKETIPILWGEVRTIRLLKGILLVCFFLLIGAGLLGIVSSLGFVLAVSPVYFYILLAVFENGRMLPGTRLESLVEFHFLLAGILTFFWSILR
jgi:4-hydroxy-3-methylbut-2-enyl diphosphate reductase